LNQADDIGHRNSHHPFNMTLDLDIYRTAKILVKEYGAAEAPLMAAKRAEDLAKLDNVNGQRVWMAVMWVAQELIRRERKPAERLS
jgi:hypothetical protein